MALVEVKGLTKVYRGVENVTIFKNANMTIGKGELVGLLAPSGYGKSTLIYILSGLMSYEGGSVKVMGKELKELNSREKVLMRRKHIGIVYQFFNLLPTLTALENVMLPMELIGFDPKESEKRAKELLELVGLEHRKDHFPHKLSGGEQQRVAFARALANNPDLILADEPTGNLDERNADLLFDIIRKLNRETGVTILVASHDTMRCREYLDKLYTIKNHKIVEYGV